MYLHTVRVYLSGTTRSITCTNVTRQYHPGPLWQPSSTQASCPKPEPFELTLGVNMYGNNRLRQGPSNTFQAKTTTHPQKSGDSTGCPPQKTLRTCVRTDQHVQHHYVKSPKEARHNSNNILMRKQKTKKRVEKRPFRDDKKMRLNSIFSLTDCVRTSSDSFEKKNDRFRSTHSDILVSKRFEAKIDASKNGPSLGRIEKPIYSTKQTNKKMIRSTKASTRLSLSTASYNTILVKGGTDDTG